jgi:hypothetical protein
LLKIGDNEKGSGLRVGRQELTYGDERLVGPTPWLNVARRFDAARATFRHDKFRLDIFASAVVVLKDGEVGQVQPGNNLHGIYGGITNVIPNSVIEPYVFWRLSPRIKTETGGIGTSIRRPAAYGGLENYRRVSTTVSRWRSSAAQLARTWSTPGPDTGSLATPGRRPQQSRAG